PGELPGEGTHPERPAEVTGLDAPAGNAAPESNRGQPPKPDGPFEPYGFRYGSVEAEFTKGQRRLYRLLLAMWPAYRTRSPVHFDEVNDRLERAGGSELGKKAMGNYARELSTVLTGRFKLPARLEMDGSYLRWVDLPDAPACGWGRDCAAGRPEGARRVRDPGFGRVPTPPEVPPRSPPPFSPPPTYPGPPSSPPPPPSPATASIGCGLRPDCSPV